MCIVVTRTRDEKLVLGCSSYKLNTVEHELISENGQK